MANEILKQFLVSIAFKVDEASAKRQQEALSRTERQVTGLEKAEKDAHVAGGKRATEVAARAEGMASAARIAGAGVVAFAAVVTGAMTALAVHLQKALGDFDKLYYVAGRTGASVNNIKALGHAFEQTGSSAGRAMAMLENFAKARRTNPGVDGLIRSLGVDTRGDASEVLGNALDAAKAKNPYFTAAQIAQQFGISEEDYEHFTRYRKEIGRFREEYKALQKTMGVDGNETASAANRIARAFGTLHATVEVLGDKLTQVLAPVVEKVVNLFRDWVASNPERVEAIMRKIASALEAVGTWLSKSETWDGFSAFWTKLYTGIEKVVSIVNVLLDALFKLGNIFNSGPLKKYLDFMFGGGVAGQLFGGSAQAAEGGAGAGAAGGANDNGSEKPGLFRRGWNAVKRAFGGNADLTPTPGSKATISGRTFDSKAPGIMKRLMADFNLSKEEAAVVLGNLGHESAGFTAFEEGGNGPGRGWAQWTDLGRKARFFKYATDNKLDQKSDEANYGFLKWELENTHRSSIAKLKRAEGGQAKMYAFEQDFEGAGIKHYDRRFNYMRKAMEAYDRSEQGGVQEGASTARPAFRSNVAPGARMSPGGFDVNAYLRTPPMGATSNTTDSSKTFHNNAPVTVNVTGGSGDAASIGAAAGRGAAMAGDMNLRNVQTALR